MTTFTDLPKQWLVARDIPQSCGGVAHAAFEGWQIRTAAQVPVLSLQSADGEDLGRIIGWASWDGVFYREDTTITLTQADSPRQVYERMSGRCVLFWAEGPERALRLCEDGSGLLPAIYAPDHQAIGSTTTALKMLAPLTPDSEVAAIYDFPKRKGFLPFGLTAHKDAYRLMPNHVLDLPGFTSRRSWPDAEFCNRPAMTLEMCTDATYRCAELVAEHIKAIVTAQGDTILYLSGGQDSRAIVAAAQRGGSVARMVFHTVDNGTGRDINIAGKIARKLGRPHTVFKITPTSQQVRDAWIKRAGGSIYDHVTDMAGTMMQRAPLDKHPLSGTGVDLVKGGNWMALDIESTKLEATTLLERMQIPNVPRIVQRAQAWLMGLPEQADAPLILDLAKIEIRHGCWSGAAIYGLDRPLPSLHPFSGVELHKIVLSMPPAYRFSGAYFNDFISLTAPSLQDIPVNKALGLDRLRFWKEELRAAVPRPVKRWIKALR